MKNRKENFKRYVISLSFKEKRKRELSKYRKRISEIKKMDADELDFEYISLKSKYEHKRNILTLFIISIVLAVLMNVWNSFFEFIEKVLRYTEVMAVNGEDVAKVGFIIAIISVVFITALVLFVLSCYIKDIYHIRKELMIIEAARKMPIE